MTDYQARLLEVTEVSAGSEVTQDYAVGAKNLLMYTTTEFNDAGGQVITDDGIIYNYTGKDDDTGTLYLDPAGVGLTAALSADDSLYLYPLSLEKQAMVQIDDEDPITATVPHALYDALEDLIRAEVDWESVIVTRDGADAVIKDIVGQAVVRDGSYIDPTTLPPTYIPTSPPATSPSLVVQGLTASFLVKADDVEQTTTIEYHISTTSGFTPGPTTLSLTTRATLVAINQMPDGSPLIMGTTYYFKAIAKNVAGSAVASAEVSAQLTQITSTQITDGAILTPKLAAGSVTADIVEAGVFHAAYTLTGSLQIGNITLTPGDPSTGDPGGLLIPLASGGVIQFPADGSAATVQANLHALSATVDDNLTINGQGNDLAGKVTVTSIPTAPSANLAAGTNIALQTGAGFQQTADVGLTDNTGYVNSLIDGGTVWYAMTKRSTFGKTDIVQVDKTTGAVTTLISDVNGTFLLTYNALSLTRVGTNWYMSQVRTSTASNRVIRKYDSSWNQIWSVTCPTDWDKGLPAMGQDASGNVLVAGWVGTTFKVYVLSASTGAVTANVTLAGVASGLTAASVNRGDFDFGAGTNRYVVTFSDGSTRVYSGGTEQTTNKFTAPSNTARASVWDGSRFWLAVSNSNLFDVRKLSTVIATSVSRAIKYTQYCDGTRSGSTGAIETKASPVKNINQNARAYLSVTVPPSSDAGNANDPNAVRIYVNAHLVATMLNTSSRTYVIDAAPTSGADSPATEGYSSSTPGVSLGSMQSQQSDTYGPVFQISGDGNGRWEAIQPTGAIQMFGGSTAPFGWLLCQGQSLLRTDYPRLFAVIGTTFGSVDGTHFTLPNLVGRFPLGAGTDTDGTARALGTSGGSTHMSSAQMPQHAHDISVRYSSDVVTTGAGMRILAVGGIGNTGAGTAGTGTTANTGSGNAYYQPYTAVNYIIKY